MPVDDYRIETLLNQSAQGDGRDRRIAFVPIDLCGPASHRASAIVTNIPEQITIGVGKRSIEIHNSGDNPIYYGGSGVTFLTGIIIFSRQTKPFVNVKDDFSIYIVAETDKNSSRNIVEYE